MKARRLSRVALQGLFAGFLVWLYLGDLARAWRVSSANLAMLNLPPTWWLSILGSVTALARDQCWLARSVGGRRSLR